jgi:hypothetical protein
MARYCYDRCSRHALAMARAWQEHGKEHGKVMTRTWQDYCKHMAGKHMAGAWQEHGNYMERAQQYIDMLLPHAIDTSLP